MQHDLSGIILAGGRGIRLGGVDKGLLEVNGQPLIALVTERLRPQVDEVIISANRNLDRYAAWADSVVTDQVPGYQGPLAGLASAMHVARHHNVLIVPCDSPLFPLDLGAALLAKMLQADVDACVVRDSDRLQPLFGVYRRRVLPGLLAWLGSGERRAQEWLRTLNWQSVGYADARAFANINTPDDLDVVAGQSDLE